MAKLKYEVPKCECGKELKLVEEYVYHHVQTINKNGSLSKKKKIEPWRSYGTWWLQCTDIDCNRDYEYEIDEEGRVLRGDRR